MKNITINKLGGRKFILTVLLDVVFTIFVVSGKMSVMEFLTVMPIVNGIYIAGNVTQKFSE